MDQSKTVVGQDLDRAVAVHVMDWTKEEDGWPLGDCLLSVRLFFPSTRADDAFMVVGRMRKLGYRLMLRQVLDDSWEASFYAPSASGHSSLCAVETDDTAPAAISRAALATIIRPLGDAGNRPAWRCPPGALRSDPDSA